MDAYDWSPEQRAHVKEVECLRLLHTLKQNTSTLTTAEASSPLVPHADAVASTSHQEPSTCPHF
jgi:hypothetical protein